MAYMITQGKIHQEFVIDFDILTGVSVAHYVGTTYENYLDGTLGIARLWDELPLAMPNAFALRVYGTQILKNVSQHDILDKIETLFAPEFTDFIIEAYYDERWRKAC